MARIHSDGRQGRRVQNALGTNLVSSTVMEISSAMIASGLATPTSGEEMQRMEMMIQTTDGAAWDDLGSRSTAPRRHDRVRIVLHLRVRVGKVVLQCSDQEDTRHDPPYGTVALVEVCLLIAARHAHKVNLPCPRCLASSTHISQHRQQRERLSEFSGSCSQPRNCCTPADFSIILHRRHPSLLSRSRTSEHPPLSLSE